MKFVQIRVKTDDYGKLSELLTQMQVGHELIGNFGDMASAIANPMTPEQQDVIIREVGAHCT
ncbi:hypothetical protein [Escherichia phage EP_H11]|nr:hypothetical protein [Escherichia phage EP_H11]